MDISTFGVIGAGQMGNGIAQVIASQAGLDVIICDIKDEFLAKGMATIDKNLSRMVAKEKISEDEKTKILSKIKTTTDISAMKDADFVVEAASEVEEIKFKIFKTLDEICKKDAILATNTSSIPIGRIASVTSRPEKVIGMHFMNPVPVMKLIEVIRGIATSDETFDTTWELSQKLNKVPALANDFPGFILNRLLIPMLNEAIYALYHSVGTKEDIDTIMKFGANHPMGPLALADLIGLDTCLAIMKVLYEGFKDSKYRPCPLLQKYVDAGWLGRKSGKGFYDYK